MVIDFRFVALGMVALGGLLLHNLVNTMPEASGTAAPATVDAPQARPAAAAPAERAPEGPAAGSQAEADKGRTNIALATPSSQEAATPKLPATAARAAVPAPAPAALPPVQGKSGVGAAEAKPYTHFRVGNRNVKRIVAEGGRVWVATSGGVIRYDAATDDYRLYDERSGLRSGQAVHVGKLGKQLVVGTTGGGLSVLDAQGERWEHHRVGETPEPGTVQDVLAASNGDVWIASRAGVSRVRGGRFADRDGWTHFGASAEGQGLPSERAYGLAEGRNGDIWVATERGLAVYREGGWRAMRPTSAAPANAAPAHGGTGPDGRNFVVAVAVDRAGVVWAGTLGGGLLRYDGRQWRTYTTADGLPGNQVLMLHHDGRGKLWAGTEGGLARLDGGKFTVLTTKDGLFSNAVFAMASTPDALWVGSYGGVARIRLAP